MEIYVHGSEGEDPTLVEVEAGSRVRELAVVSEGEEACLIFIEEGEEPLDLDITIEEAGIHHHRHVHRGHCRKVEVHVRYNGETHSRHFSPAATVARVFAWAVGPESFDLTPEQQAEHMLALPGADHGLDGGVHIGSVVTKGTCEVVLDLLPKGRFQG